MVESERNGANVVGPAEEDSLAARREQLDRDDANRVRLYERSLLTHALMEKARAAGDKALARELALECQLFASAGSAGRGPTPEGAPELGTAEGIAYLRGRLGSPSVVVRALAARFLWSVARSQMPRAGKTACEAYLEWFHAAAEHTVRSRHGAQRPARAGGVP